MRTRMMQPINQDEEQAVAHLGELLQQALQPMQPNPVFVQSLRDELVTGLSHRPAASRGARRTAIVAAAAVGSIISVASVVGAVVYLVTRHRAQVRPARA